MFENTIDSGLKNILNKFFFPLTHVINQFEIIIILNIFKIIYF